MRVNSIRIQIQKITILLSELPKVKQQATNQSPNEILTGGGISFSDGAVTTRSGKLS